MNSLPIKCPNCRTELIQRDRFCPHCGIDLEAQPKKNQEKALSYYERAQFKYDHDVQLSQALTECELALEHDPNFAEAHNLRGLILDALNRPNEAIMAYREAIRLKPGLKEAQANLQDAESEQGPDSPAVAMAEESGSARAGLIRLIISTLTGFALLACIAAGYFLFNNYLLPILGPKTELVLVPDVPEGVSVVQADFINAANILTERSRLLGYSQVTFKASSNGTLVGQIPFNVDANELAGQISRIGLLEFVDFGDTRVNTGEEVRTDLESRYLVQVDGEEWHTVMSNGGIGSAQAIPQNGSYQVGFTLTAEGTRIFAEHTSQNIGKYLGIVLDKVVASEPMIQRPITDGQGVISGNFTRESADELAAILQTKPLPFPVKTK